MQVSNLKRHDAQEPVTALALGGMQVGGRPGGWTAQLEQAGYTLHVSRIDGEPVWVVDGVWERSLPIFHNGAFSRCTRTQTVTAEAAVALDAALAAVVA